MGTSIIFLLLPCVLITLPLLTAQQCDYSSNFTTNSTYGPDRNRILSSLASNATAKGGFFNITFTQGSDTIYALALCRGDLRNRSCYECVDTASQDIITNCPTQKEAYGLNFGAPSHCIVWCSDQSFFGTMVTSPYEFSWTGSNITDNVHEFDKGLNSLVNSLVIRVTTGTSVGKFATGETSFYMSKKIYGLVQCIPDLSSDACNTCIETAVDVYRNCCLRNSAVNIVTPSCIFQYNSSSFFESLAGAASPPPLPSPPPPPVSLYPPPPSINITTKGGIFVVSLKLE